MRFWLDAAAAHAHESVSCPQLQAAEYIYFLRSQVEKLQLENMELKQNFLNEVKRQQSQVCATFLGPRPRRPNFECIYVCLVHLRRFEWGR